jgi:hypothetical protein
LITVSIWCIAAPTQAYPPYLQVFSNKYGTLGTQVTRVGNRGVCHVNPSSSLTATKHHNPCGIVFVLQLLHSINLTTALKHIENYDSESDGLTNLLEIMQKCFPRHVSNMKYHRLGVE